MIEGGIRAAKVPAAHMQPPLRPALYPKRSILRQGDTRKDKRTDQGRPVYGCEAGRGPDRCIVQTTPKSGGPAMRDGVEFARQAGGGGDRPHQDKHRNHDEGVLGCNVVRQRLEIREHEIYAAEVPHPYCRDAPHGNGNGYSGRDQEQHGGHANRARDDWIH